MRVRWVSKDVEEVAMARAAMEQEGLSFLS